MQLSWDASLSVVLAEWVRLEDGQRTQVADQLRDIVATGDVTALRGMSVLYDDGANLLLNAMTSLAEAAALQVVAEAAAQDSWDLIIVDTPPSRSALDFLDAPKRLGSFLDGRLIKILAAPARGAGRFTTRVMSASFGVFSNVLTKIIGAQVLRDLQVFVASFDALFGGFRERAEATYAQLKAPDTRFIVVAIPETDALREASYFVERLANEQMPLAGLVLNRVIPVATPDLTAEAAEAGAELLADLGSDQVTQGLLRLHASRMTAARRQQHVGESFVAAHPGVKVACVPVFGDDVHDLAGLREIGRAAASTTS